MAKVFLCKAEGVSLPGEGVAGVRAESFAGPHPAGLAGTHIHFLDPVSATKSVWTIGYQDVIAVGKLFTTGQLWTERVVALAGPGGRRSASGAYPLGGQPRRADRRRTQGGRVPQRLRSVFGGRTARGPLALPGRYHQQVSCLREGSDREMMHYLRAGVEQALGADIFVSKLAAGRLFDFTTTTNGSPRQGARSATTRR